MKFADLQIFKAVVEEGGIVRAAQRLHRVPSNVTTRIKHLEEAVGMPLFHRDRQRLHLSPSGELLLGYAERLIRLSEEARHMVSGAAPQGALKLGSLESTTASRLPALLADYHRRFPEVRLELTTGTNDALLKAVAERRVDAAFIAEPPPEQTIAFMPVFRERLTLISSPRHAAIRHPRDVQGETIIAFPEGCSYRRVLQRWLGKQSLAAARVMELSSYHAIVAVTAAGAGVALVPEAVLDTMPHARVQRHAIPKAHGEVVTPLVWRAGEVSPPVLALRELVGEMTKKSKAAPSPARAAPATA